MIGQYDAKLGSYLLDVQKYAERLTYFIEEIKQKRWFYIEKNRKNYIKAQLCNNYKKRT
jgi:hypothetical protein